MKRNILRIILIILTIIAVYRIAVLIKNKINEGKATKVEKRIPVKAVAVKRMNMADSIKLTGDVIGTEVVNVFSQVPGKVQEILIKEGQKVFKGQILFRINRDIVGMDYMPAIVESPITGYVGKVMVDRGMTITAIFPLAQVVNMNNVEAVINIIEEDINRIAIGMNAEIKVETFPKRIFYGRVYKKSAVVDPQSRTLQAKILLQNPKLELKHGMFADISIIINKKANVIAIPVDALIQDKGSVYKVVNNKARKQKVTTGITVNNYVEITSGLKEDDLIISFGHENVIDGDNLLIYREDIEDVKEKDSIKKDGMESYQ